MKTQVLMSRQPQTCRPEDSLQRAAQIMWEHDCGCVPVVDADGQLVGIVTDRDACMSSYTRGQPLTAIAVGSAMSREVVTVRADESAAAAAKRMGERGVRRLPVVDRSGALVGLLSLADLAGLLPGRKRAAPRAEITGAFCAVTRPRAPQPEVSDLLVPAARRSSAKPAQAAAAKPARLTDRRAAGSKPALVRAGARSASRRRR